MPNWSCDDDSDTCCNGGMICERTCPRRLEDEARQRDEERRRERPAQLSFRLDGFDAHSYGFEDEIPPRIFVKAREMQGPKRKRKKAKSFKEAKAPSRHARAQETEIVNYTRDRFMKITAVRYERVSSLGNYETERIAVESTVEPTETPRASSPSSKPSSTINSGSRT